MLDESRLFEWHQHPLAASMPLSKQLEFVDGRVPNFTDQELTNFNSPILETIVFKSGDLLPPL
jgi:hypothetical protein